jgi:hypothetical protein
MDVYAPGQDLVNAFPVGGYTDREPAPAGLIAARMSETAEDGRAAAAALPARAHTQAQPGVGAVPLPG